MTVVPFNTPGALPPDPQDIFEQMKTGHSDAPFD